ncbi:MAG: hypothetical protein ACYCZF_07850 [Anaerolineae bacterium]
MDLPSIAAAPLPYAITKCLGARHIPMELWVGAQQLGRCGHVPCQAWLRPLSHRSFGLCSCAVSDLAEPTTDIPLPIHLSLLIIITFRLI